jgi:hypothetical protein
MTRPPALNRLDPKSGAVMRLVVATLACVSILLVVAATVFHPVNEGAFIDGPFAELANTGGGGGQLLEIADEAREKRLEAEFERLGVPQSGRATRAQPGAKQKVVAPGATVGPPAQGPQAAAAVAGLAVTGSAADWHGETSFLHGVESDMHEEPSTTHSVETYIHDPPSNTHSPATPTHYLDTNTHFEPSDIHSVPSDTHSAPSDVHAVTSVTHADPSDHHGPGSDAHHEDSADHTIISDTHLATTSFHTASSDNHYNLSSAHDQNSSSHSAESNTHASTSDYHAQSSDIHRADSGTDGGKGCLSTLYIAETYLKDGTEHRVEHEGPVIIRTRDDDEDYPLGDLQVEDGKLSLTYEFRVELDIAPPPCGPPTAQPEPFLPIHIPCKPDWLLGEYTVLIRLEDPADTAIYTENPTEFDNLDPRISRGNLTIAPGYNLHPRYTPEVDNGNLVRVAVLPEFIELIDSSVQYNLDLGIKAYLYRVEFEVNVSTDFAGDNYSVEIQQGFANNPPDWADRAMHAVTYGPDCYEFVPEFRDLSEPGYDWNPDFMTRLSFGPFAAWQRLYIINYNSRLSGNELKDDLDPGDIFLSIYHEYPFWWPDAQGNWRGTFVPGDQVRVLDAGNPTGEVAIIQEIAGYQHDYTWQGSKNAYTTYRLVNPVVGEYKSGHPEGLANQKPDGLGALAILDGKEAEHVGGQAGMIASIPEWYNQASGRAFVEIKDLVPGGIDVGCSISAKPLGDVEWISWGGDPDHPDSKAYTNVRAFIAARMRVWYPAFDTELVDPQTLGCVNIKRVYQSPSPLVNETVGGFAMPGVGPFAAKLQAPPYFCIVGWTSVEEMNGWAGFGAPEQHVKEVTAHEWGHMLGTIHCNWSGGGPTHSSGVVGNSPCIMSDSDWWYGPAYVDGSIELGHTLGDAPEQSPAECYEIRNRRLEW